VPGWYELAGGPVAAAFPYAHPVLLGGGRRGFLPLSRRTLSMRLYGAYTAKTCGARRGKRQLNTLLRMSVFLIQKAYAMLNIQLLEVFHV
jgi:hypothetical protein